MQDFTVIFKFFSTLLLTYFYFSPSAISKTPSQLAFSDKSQTLETPYFATRSLSLTASLLTYYPVEQPFLIKQNLSQTIDPLKPFASLEKLVIKDQLKHSHMLFMHPLKNTYLIFDGIYADLRLWGETLELISHHSLVYDRLLPPRDRGGEAPHWEISDFRKKFLSQYHKTPAEKFAGFVPVPSSWLKAKDSLYLVASRIPSFPLLMMQCQDDNPSQCFIARGCFTEGFSMPPDAVSGIALLDKERLILVGNAAAHKIEAFKFHSCMHITKSYDITLPQQIKKLASLFIDHQERLWLTSLQPDDYHNATIYWWAPKDYK